MFFKSSLNIRGYARIKSAAPALNNIDVIHSHLELRAGALSTSSSVDTEEYLACSRLLTTGLGIIKRYSSILPTTINLAGTSLCIYWQNALSRPLFFGQKV